MSPPTAEPEIGLAVVREGPGAGGPDVPTVLAAAVAAVNGTERPGQVQMAEAVAGGIESGEHLLVQSGTGTGKSLAYLVPALLYCAAGNGPVVVATATIALQNQIVERDLPILIDAVEPLLRRRPTFAILKGRGNYVCRNRVFGGMPDDSGGDALFDASPTTALGRDVVRVRSWAEDTETGDRDELDPGVSDRAWRQVSVSARECLGAQKCPFGDSCFAEKARALAAEVDLVVTNHAMLAIDALENFQIIPEHDVVVVDEGHELVDRVTGVATGELTTAMVEAAATRSRRLLDDDIVNDLVDAAAALDAAFEAQPAGRLVDLPEHVHTALLSVRDAARAAHTDLARLREADEGRRQMAQAAVGIVFTTADRLVAQSAQDVAWISHDQRRGSSLRVAPLSVGGLLRTALFETRTAILTSATLELGGSFNAVAAQVGLIGDDAPAWAGIDVGSPFDYQRQSILYVASRLPPPGRDGISAAVLEELAGLITAAGGRTLGLFSSTRAAEAAAEAMRTRLDLPILCQGDDRTASLVRQFAADPATCLFGTLTLWQGVDVPGDACRLVVIDRIPFPRPDDPLMSARAQAVSNAGGNGFMAVSATHAAVRLAQGSGRLIRTSSDRGVVAVLDSRLATAGYGAFLRSSMPPFWFTTDPDRVTGALARLAAESADRSA